MYAMRVDCSKIAVTPRAKKKKKKELQPFLKEKPYQLEI